MAAMTDRVSVLVAANAADANWAMQLFPQYRCHIVLTGDQLALPRSMLVKGTKLGEYSWTLAARELPASVRLRLRGLLAPLVDDDSCEEEFIETLSSW